MKKISLMNVTLFVTATLFGSALVFADDIVAEKQAQVAQAEKSETKDKMAEQLMTLTETKVVPVAFAAFDKDKNGSISKEEIDAGSDEKLKLAFNRIDINQDGLLSEEEFKTAISK